MSRIEDAVSRIKKVDTNFHAKAQARLDILTKPQGSLGMLEEFAMRLVGIYANEMPELPRKIIFTFAGDHGIADAGVSAFPKEVTPQMVFNFIRGGAGINVLARQAGADVAVVDAGVDFDFEGAEGMHHKKVVRGTRNMLDGPAMTREETERCIEVGIGLASEYKGKGYSLMGTGDMGIGNTTASSAICACITGDPVKDVTGRGTGIDDKTLESKIAAIEKALLVNRPDPADGIDVLGKVGGAEIGAIAGLCLGAAAEGLPVVVDGFISTAGALIAYTIEPKVAEYMFSAHRSVEKGQGAMLDKMGLTPILDLGMRLGEGTGSALGMMLMESGLRIYRDMATFADAGVSEQEG
jgi:nicotinate-nucleotide--dimethylbenzimidazole phosphoribosyltransferase